MHLVLFYHSLICDWNHGNAHFLRGICSELLSLGHTVKVFERENGWSLRHLREQQGEEAVSAFHAAYPHLKSEPFDPQSLELDVALEGADVVIVHEWNEPAFVQRVGRHRALHRYRLLFHDTHHRAVSATEELQTYDLSGYDGVLAFGEVLRRIYEDRGWCARAWTWHEAADTRLFRPVASPVNDPLDLVWIGNWGDGERARELQEFLITPVRELGLRARIHGVRYPVEALHALAEARIEYAGWIANFKVPEAFAGARVTVHVPRRFYCEQLPGIPTIRVFEALACGIPLVSAPWEDSEGLFSAGRDYLQARNGAQMREHLQSLRADPEYAQRLADHGLQTIRARHTCAHRVRQLLSICRELGVDSANPAASQPAAAQVARAGLSAKADLPTTDPLTTGLSSTAVLA
jgi:spore maturation protein CgeB